MSTAKNEVATLRKELSDLRAENEALREELDTVKTENETLSERVDLLLKEKAQDRQRIAELEDYRAENEYDKATIRQQVAGGEQTDATAAAESDENDARVDSMTPMGDYSNSVNKASWPTSPPLCGERRPSPLTSANGPRRHRTGWSSRTTSRPCCRPPRVRS